MGVNTTTFCHVCVSYTDECVCIYFVCYENVVGCTCIHWSMDAFSYKLNFTSFEWLYRMGTVHISFILLRFTFAVCLGGNNATSNRTVYAMHTMRTHERVYKVNEIIYLDFRLVFMQFMWTIPSRDIGRCEFKHLLIV